MLTNNIRNFIAYGIKKYYTNFKKYTIIGIIFTLIEIFLLGFFVDILQKDTLISSILIIGPKTILKFYAYVYSGMMNNNLFGYIFIFAVFFILNVALILFFVDVLGFYASVTSVFLNIILFFLRFYIYDKFKLLKNQ